MLVLSRKHKQVIEVYHHGEVLRIAVVQIDPNAVRLGFEGSREFNIVREEISDRNIRTGDAS